MKYIYAANVLNTGTHLFPVDISFTNLYIGPTWSPIIKTGYIFFSQLFIKRTYENKMIGPTHPQYNPTDNIYNNYRDKALSKASD